MSIRSSITNKNVLFVPVFSSRSYASGEYDLSTDGNMARVISMITVARPAKAVILIPEKSINRDVVLRQLTRDVADSITFLPCPAYGKNAFATRLNGEQFIEFINSNEELLQVADYDYIIVEPNLLAASSHHIKLLNVKIIYWCVASVTDEGTPWFVENFAELDKSVARRLPTECVLESQVRALGGLSYADEAGFYSPEAFDYETIFFPFRLSDKSYHAKEFAEAVNMLAERSTMRFKVLFTDVNDSGIFDSESDLFVKVPSQKEVYLEILKSRPIVPYLENTKIITHINIHEMLYYGCDLIMVNDPAFASFDCVSFIDEISPSEIAAALLHDIIVRKSSKMHRHA